MPSNKGKTGDTMFQLFTIEDGKLVPVVAKPKEPRRNPDGSMQKARSRPIRSGKEAASAAYANLAIRQHIFKMVDRTTLAIMMRLDKASMKSVSDVLYKEIHVSLVSKMSRKPARRAIYCDAVRIVDRNPHPKFENPTVLSMIRPAPRGQKDPISVDPAKLTKEVDGYIKKFPNLELITYEYPTNHADDSYIIHIKDGEITIDVETTCEFDLEDDCPEATDPLGDPAPVFPEWEVRHTIAILLKIGSPIVLLMGSVEARNEHVGRWKSWLYENPNLDHRIRKIDHSAVGPFMDRNVEESIAWINQRKDNNCPPTSFALIHIPMADNDEEDEVTLDDIRRLAQALGPDLRTLKLGGTVIFDFSDNLQSIIDELDQFCPNLKKLVLSKDSIHAPLKGDDAYLLSGLHNLRILDFANELQYEEPEDVPDLASVLYQLGHRDCVFHCHGFLTIKEMREFDDLVHDYKIHPRVYKKKTSDFGIVTLYSWGNPNWRSWSVSDGYISP